MKNKNENKKEDKIYGRRGRRMRKRSTRRRGRSISRRRRKDRGKEGR
jgi:hypothetical protein